MLCELIVQHGLIALNTRFKKSKKKLSTFMYPKGKNAQLDYILGRKNGVIASKTVIVTTLFDTIGSDPRIVSWKVNISYRQSKPSPKSPLSKIDWKAVLRKVTTIYRTDFAVGVYNRYEALSEQMKELSTDNRYEALIGANANVAEIILLRKRKRKGIAFKNFDLIHARNLL